MESLFFERNWKFGQKVTKYMRQFLKSGSFEIKNCAKKISTADDGVGK